MKTSPLPIILAAIFLVPLTVQADPDKDESGNGPYRHSHQEYKEEYWDGNCKVERTLEKSGEYKEEHKCKSPGQHGYGGAPAYAPAPVYVPVPAVPSGVIIQGTVHVR